MVTIALDICSDTLPGLESSLMPIIGLTALITGLIIILSYMFSEATNNPKIKLWAKTEAVQLFFSLFFVLILWSVLTSFCLFNISSVAELFNGGAKLVVDQNVERLNIFQAAQSYFERSAFFIINLLQAVRYHISAYNILQMHSLFQCEDNPVLSIIWCIFGSVFGFGGGSGVSISPDGGYGIPSSLMSMAMNSLLFDLMVLFNFMFILRYVYTGFVFFFLPLGIFLRSFPYMRGLGSLLMAISFSFLVVYPLVLSLFYLDIINPNSVLIPNLDDPANSKIKYYANNEAYLEDMNDISNYGFDMSFYDDIFGDHGGTAEVEIMKFSGNAFIVGVFIPTFALLAAIGSVTYLNRLLGQEIDLSRIFQMV